MKRYLQFGQFEQLIKFPITGYRMQKLIEK